MMFQAFQWAAGCIIGYIKGKGGVLVNGSLLGLLVVLLVLLVVFGPMIGIWSLNVLFGLAIPYTFKTWFAALWLGGLLGGKVATSRK